MGKFVQITSHGRYLYALDEDGVVWQFDYEGNYWRRVAGSRIK